MDFTSSGLSGGHRPGRLQCARPQSPTRPSAVSSAPRCSWAPLDALREV